MACISPISIMQNSTRHVVPCGKCAFCLRSKRNDWIIRLHHESRNQLLPAYFLTLTYDEKHVPRYKGTRTLWFRHLQLYFKRIRKSGASLKYVAVGEYGSATARPHYHVICWTSASEALLDKQWHHGNVHFGQLTPASIAYTLKYIIQPKQGDNETRQKTRAQFSKGLGAGYLTSAVHQYHSGDEENPVFETRFNGAVRPLPRYYRDKLFTSYQKGKHRSKLYWQTIKERRKEFRRLKKLGHAEPFKYMRERQLRAALGIVTKVNYNQKL